MAGPGNHLAGDIDGERVVWQDNVGGQYDIGIVDLRIGIPAAITSDAAYQSSPRVSGDLVVWEDFRNDPNPDDSYYDYDIYMKDLTTGLESPLAAGPSIQARPAVDREAVVWEDTAAGNYDVWMTTVPDSTPPEIGGANPADGSSTCASATVSASVSDNRSGIDAQSLTMLLDGADVTAATTLADGAVVYDPGIMAEGGHAVSLTMADKAGNSTTLEWGFTISSPKLSIPDRYSFWDTYDDYLNGILTVRFTVADAAAAAPALSAQILASPASAGVITIESLPTAAMDITTGGQAEIQMKYMIPPGVATFKTTIFIGCLDSCGSQYYFPGAPPG